MSTHKNFENDNAKAHSDTNINQSNWYTKLHPIGASQQQAQSKKLLNLSIFFRIWLAVALVLIVSGTVVFTQLFEHVKPTAQQVIEDTLLDTSKMMAANLQQPLQSGRLLESTYQRQLDSAFVATDRQIKNNRLYDVNNEPEYKLKSVSSFRLYVTDNKGIVLYDSLPTPMSAEGEDYSRWNDVYLTLKGQYGARSTPDTNSTRDSSIMYVAQPIKNELGQLIGVVSVGKPIDSVLPYLDNTRQRMLITTLLISAVSLILAGLVAWWLKQSISLVTRYTGALAEDTKKPYFYLGNELNSLTDTIETMKHRLENRAYVSDYVHTLTHELKSPLTAIRASSELLEDEELDKYDRQMLSKSIGEQSLKMQHLIDRLLLLAKVEQPTFKLNRHAIALTPMLTSLIKDNSSKTQQRDLSSIALVVNKTLKPELSIDDKDQPTPLSKVDIDSEVTISGDSFWLVQALQNVLDNAIYFAQSTVSIHVTSKAKTATIDIYNDGLPLPEYALTKAFDRYFSLSHQIHPSHINSNEPHLKKGTGLGLTLVKQVIEHHGGSVIISNVTIANNNAKGVVVRITLPLTTVTSQ